MFRSPFKIAFLTLLPASTSLAAGDVTFEKDIRPILKAHCFHCHGEDNTVKGGLDIRLVKWMMKGGENGPSVVAHAPEKSHLLKMLQSGEMPEGKPKLPDELISLVETWIKQGAKTARPEPDSLTADTFFTEEDRAWWSFQPIAEVIPPKDHGKKSALNEVDDFIAKELKKNELEFSPKAEPHVLLRRLTYSLIGLAPTLEETESFVKAYAENPELAYDATVERLLSSPHYGERWAQHWLDLAGYADSDGVTEKDLVRPFAYKFRDYVIKSFNEDKPIDQFITEQLAGDELVKWPHVELSEADTEKMVATGFLRMGPDGTGATNTVEMRQLVVQDSMQILGSAIYGMTLACAQCHDHRYDPISHKDYYQVRSIFEPGFNPDKWRVPAGRLVSLQNAEDRKIAAEIEEQAKVVDQQRLEKGNGYVAEVLEKELLKLPEADRAKAKEGYHIPRAKRTPEQTDFMKKYPRVNQLSISSLYLYDTTYKTKYDAELKALAAKALEIRNTKPPQEYLQAFQELPMPEKLVPVSKLFHRGDYLQPKDPMPPSDLDVFNQWRSVDIPAKDPKLPTSGRRLAFAKMLTDGEHPLTTRVFVNQIWRRHFGYGLVRSVDDFGHLGQKPSHPELLDYLARRFSQEGWSLKKLHRLLVKSHTFQQSSKRSSEHQELVDPDNKLLSRMNVLRLDAEALRDTMIQATGLLNRQLYGKPVPVTLDEQSQVVLGEDTRDAALRQTGKHVDLMGQEYRRSIYVQKRRSMPLEVLAAFDAPSMNEVNCASRTHSTVSPQSLILMNGGYTREYSQNVAEKVDSLKFTNPQEKVQHLWQLCYQRSANAEEVAFAVQFLQAQEAHYRSTPAKFEYVSRPSAKAPTPAPLLALAALSQALLSSNEFLYVH